MTSTYTLHITELVEKFLSHVSTLTHDIDIANMYVRLSVCPSVRPLHSGIE